MGQLSRSRPRPTCSSPFSSAWLPSWVVRMSCLGRSTIYRLMAEDRTSSIRRCASASAPSLGAGSTSIVGALVAPRSPTNAIAASSPLANALAYADIDSFNTAPISSIAPSTFPQRQVVNQ